MTVKDYIKNCEDIPTVRIAQVTMQDFRGVGYGRITFSCGRYHNRYGQEADILGVCGQNGSGKTAFIEALAIMQDLVRGLSVPGEYTDCIAVDKKYSKLEFVFDLRYKGGITRTLSYSFRLAKREPSGNELREYQHGHERDPVDYGVSSDEYRLVVSDEMISLSWDRHKKQTIIDTSPDDKPFIPETKRKEMAGSSPETMAALEMNKQHARKNSCSFIFMPDTLELFLDHDNVIFCQVLAELNYFASSRMCVMETKGSGFIRLNAAVPVYTSSGMRMINVRHPEVLSYDQYEEITEYIEDINPVLAAMVPGLEICLRELSPAVDSKGDPAYMVMAMARRDGKELPLRDESDGVRRIISILGLIIRVFNDQSFTAAVDELDAGVFEYLLGEILQILEQYGKGQFIFTSHNLRPLEVIDKKFLYFTTANPQNRYIQPENISPTANLRDLYYREIIMNEQKEQVYNPTKKYKIVNAFKEAGKMYQE